MHCEQGRLAALVLVLLVLLVLVPVRESDQLKQYTTDERHAWYYSYVVQRTMEGPSDHMHATGTNPAGYSCDHGAACEWRVSIVRLVTEPLCGVYMSANGAAVGGAPAADHSALTGSINHWIDRHPGIR